MTSTSTPRRALAIPTVITGLAMAVYLVSRPYGDAGGSTTTAAAEAFASDWWVVSHVFGAVALAAFAWLTAAFRARCASGLTRSAAVTGVLGAALVLPYYGAETFALHVIGTVALAGDATGEPVDLALLPLVDGVRNTPIALLTFGVGLVLLAVAAVLFALAWQRHGVAARFAAWPLAVGVVLMLPQYYLPPTGRIAFGLAYALASVVFVVGTGAVGVGRGPAAAPLLRTAVEVTGRSGGLGG